MMITGIPGLAELRDFNKSGRWFSLAVWLTVAAMAISVLVYVWVAASPLLVTDNWYYADTLVKHFQEGKLGLIDIIGKRPNDNSQPLNRLILLALTRWYDMDLTPQGMLGAMVAVACVVLLSWLALRAWPARGKTPWVRALLPLGFATILLSLNPTNLYTWPLVTTLTFTGSLGAVIYLYGVAELGRRGAWAWAAAAAMLALITIDTFGILAVLGSVVLFAYRAFSGPRAGRWAAMSVGVSVFIALLAYQVGYRYITHLQSTPLNGGNITAAAGYAAAHWGEAWKTFVIPFATAIYAPHDYLGATWPVLLSLAVILWCGHIWFWREFFRNPDSRLAFLGAGLMLYFYGTVAGMLLDRVPQNSFDYFFQQRYVSFYELQLVAMLLMVVVVLPKKAHPRRMASTVALLICGMLVCNACFLVRAWEGVPPLRKYDENVVAQINRLALDPANPPQGCYQTVTVCNWPLRRRLEVLQVLEDGKLNVFSAEFRQRHGYTWTDPPGPKTPVSQTH